MSFSLFGEGGCGTDGAETEGAELWALGAGLLIAAVGGTEFWFELFWASLAKVVVEKAALGFNFSSGWLFFWVLSVAVVLVAMKAVAGKRVEMFWV